MFSFYSNDLSRHEEKKPCLKNFTPCTIKLLLIYASNLNQFSFKNLGYLSYVYFLNNSHVKFFFLSNMLDLYKQRYNYLTNQQKIIYALLLTEFSIKPSKEQLMTFKKQHYYFDCIDDVIRDYCYFF